MKVLVTRPEPDASRTAERLIAAGHEVVIAPLQEIRPLSIAKPEGEFDAVAATSANALRHASERIVADLAPLPCFVVGPETARAARDAGFADVRTGPGAARGLVDIVRNTVMAGGRIAYLCGRQRKPDLEYRLGAAGFSVVAVEIYETAVVEKPADLIADGIDAALVYSAGAARRLSGAFDAFPAKTRFVCISGDAAAALPAHWRQRATVAVRPDEEGLFEALSRL